MAALARLWDRITHRMDVDVMRARRDIGCEHDAEAECDHCYLQRLADRW